MRISVHVPAAFLAALLVVGCGLPTTGKPASARSTAAENASASAVFQDLTFVGKLPARWTAADVTCGGATGGGADSFSVSLTGNDAIGQTMTLTVEVPAGYTGAGEYSVDTTASLRVAGGTPTLIATSTPQLPTRFLVQVDRRSGLIDSTMAQGADFQDAIERVYGSWRCK